MTVVDGLSEVQGVWGFSNDATHDGRDVALLSCSSPLLSPPLTMGVRFSQSLAVQTEINSDLG